MRSRCHDLLRPAFSGLQDAAHHGSSNISASDKSDFHILTLRFVILFFRIKTQACAKSSVVHAIPGIGLLTRKPQPDFFLRGLLFSYHITYFTF
jgi:hypothetical protein